MIQLEIPGRGNIDLKYAIFDVNGTIAVDGQLIDGIQKPFQNLREELDLFLLTADTHGRQKTINKELSLDATIVRKGKEAEQKGAFVERLGAENVVAFGQGANDAQMIAKAAIGICILSEEGTALETLLNADVVVPDILSGLKLLERPVRLVASLRK
jgi:P-type E1-E2 ATPase